MSNESNWGVGDEVIVYVGFSSKPFAKSKIDKIHKNGNLVVDGIRYRSHGKDFAYQTGDDFNKGFIRRATPKTIEELNNYKKLVYIRNLGAWLKTIDEETSNKIPDELIKAIGVLRLEHNTK